MKDKGKYSDNIFKHKLNLYSENPPEDIWDNIDAHLSEQKIAKRNFVFKIAASIAILVAIGTGLLITNNTSTIDNIYLNNKSLTENKSGDSKSVSPEKNISSDKSIIKNTLIYKATQTSKIKKLKQRTKNNVGKSKKIVKKDNYIVYKDIERIDPLPIKISKTEKLSINNVSVIKNIFNKNEDFRFNQIADNTIKNKKTRDYKITVGGQFSPAYSYRHLGSSAGSNDTRAYYNNVENGLLAFSGGFTVQIETNNRLSVQTGIYYSSNGQQLSQINAYSNVAYEQADLASTENSYNIANSVGDIKFDSKYVFVDQTKARVDVASSNKMFFDSDSPNFYNIGANIIQSYNYIEMPFLLKYKLIDRNIDFNVLGGLSTNVLVGKNVFLQYDGKKERIGETENLQKINYSGTMGIGLEYAIFNNFKLKLEPTINYYINSISTNSDIDLHPYSFAIFSVINNSF
jgi:hypothetical protein